jgi:molybdate transport system regulatory protein
MHSIPDESIATRRPIGATFFVSPTTKVLDPVQLAELERTFRDWATASPRRDVRMSRQRILLIFLLIRHTGAKLNEILDIKAGD